jgi:hypothetical protein
MKRALLGAAVLLTIAAVSFASSKTQTVNTDHQFHFSSANKTQQNFKNNAHHRLGNAESMEASKPAPLAQRRQAQTGLKSRANAKGRRYTANPPTGKLGFVSATQIAAVPPSMSGGATRWDAAKGDFNGDGNEDLVTIVEVDNSGSYTYALAILLGKGDGTFQTPVLTPVTDNCAVFVVGDVNGDKKDDILLVHVAGQCTNSTSNFDVLISNGDGTFTQGANYLMSPNPVKGGGLYVTTKSGYLDAVAVDLPSSTPSNVVTVLGNGDGTFSATPTTVALSGQIRKPVLADLNGDGILDVAGLDYNSNEMTVYLATSTSTYASGAVYDTSDENWDACDLAVGDVNGDSYPEIVAPNCGDGNITVFVNNKDGSYQTGVYYNAAVGGSGKAMAAGDVHPQAVTIADVNGDSKPDIISTNYYSSDVTILTGNGDGTFNVPTVGYAVGGYPNVPAVVADFNGDGIPDLVVPDNMFSLVFLKGYGDGTFRASLDYYVPIGNGNWGESVGIATGDFNGDGIPDFVVGGDSNAGSGALTVFLSRPDGSLQPGVTYGSSPCNFYVAVADFNQDGKLDFAATDCLGNVQIFTGNGDGTFTAGSTFATGAGATPDPYDLVAADFNGDGYPDLAVINYNDGSNATVGILLNDKTGNFQTAVEYTLSAPSWYGIAAADVNGDGMIDLVVPYYDSSSIAILLGNGDGTFQAEQDVSLGANYPGAVTIADVNGDGINDIVVSLEDGGGQDIAVLLGTSSPLVYQSPTYLASSLQDFTFDSPAPEYLKFVDIDGDGNPDLVYTNAEYGTVGVLFGAGGGTFYDPVEFPVGQYPWGFALADVNQDGAPDVVVASDDFAGVTVLLNANGSGALANYTVTTSANTATVTAGSNATFTFTVTPISHYNGTITFSCGTLPSLVTCTFSPAQVTMNGSPATVTLTIATAAPSVPSSSGIRRPAVTPRTHAAILLGIGGMGLFGLMLVGGKRNRWFGVALALIIVAVLFWTACGGSGNKNITPPGKSDTTTTLISSSNTVLVGTSVSFTGTVAASSGSPTGTVTFLDGATTLGTGTLSSGTATYQTSSLAAGVHSVTASYGGDTNFNPSTSSALSQTVQNPGTPAGTYTVTVTATGTAGTNGGSTSAHPVTLTVTVQ